MIDKDDMPESVQQQKKQVLEEDVDDAGDVGYFKIRFRGQGQEFTAKSSLSDLTRNEQVMIKTDHGLEPACIVVRVPSFSDYEGTRGWSYAVARRLTEEEEQIYAQLPEVERRAFKICQRLIIKHKLDMSLVRVEKFFNCSKMIFYFTADNRVDFRELVKDLVQEFRTRVEMRQVGVRHETKMIGGLGTCGRELCCSSYMKKFDSVSIKMAKEQDLPLNPAKISGVCNRLLCCLTYEFQSYRDLRRKMPKVGSRLLYNNEECKVKRQIPLQEKIVLGNSNGDEIVLCREQWLSLERQRCDKSAKKKKKTDSSE